MIILIVIYVIINMYFNCGWVGVVLVKKGWMDVVVLDYNDFFIQKSFEEGNRKLFKFYSLILCFYEIIFSLKSILFKNLKQI